MDSTLRRQLLQGLIGGVLVSAAIFAIDALGSLGMGLAFVFGPLVFLIVGIFLAFSDLT